MNDVQIPTYQDLMYPTLVAVSKLGGSAANAELEETVPVIADISDEQLAVEYPEGSPSHGKSKVIHRLHWARTYLRKIGALDSSTRGISSITPKGVEYLAMEPSVADSALKQADKDVRAQTYREKKAKAEQESTDEGDSDLDDSDDWKDILLKAMKEMDPFAFERLGMRLLREAGFRNVVVTSKSGDGGIDGVGVYRMSLVSFPTYFQCKRYAGSVSAGVVRDFRGAMTGRGEKGLIITTGTFTPAAKTEATRDGAPPLDLVDGDDLCDLLKEFELGVEVQSRVVEDVTVDVGFFDTI
jgi:restriction system protein